MNVLVQPSSSVLPEKLDLVANEIARVTQAPYELIVSILVPGIATTVQHVCRVLRKQDLDGPVGLFVITVCDSGERKSAVQKMVFGPHTELQRLWDEQAAQGVAAHKVEHRMWREKVSMLRYATRRAYRTGEPTDEIEQKLRTTLETEPTPSLARKLIYADTTIEALLEGLYIRGRSAAMVHEEFAQFCEGPMSRQLGALNAIWSGSDWTVDRKTSESFVLHGASLTCLFQAQPSVFQRFILKQGEQALGNGFFARVLLCLPPSTQGSRLESGYQPDYSTLNWFYDRCKTLLERAKPRVLKFSPSAQVEWNEVANHYENQMKPGGQFFAAKDFASKAPENIARIAAVFHAFLFDDSDEISSENLRCATNLVDYYANQYLATFQKHNPVLEHFEDLMTLEKWIFSTWHELKMRGVSKSYILQFGPNRLRQKSKLDPLLENLVQSNRIVAQRNKKGLLYFPISAFRPVYNMN